MGITAGMFLEPVPKTGGLYHTLSIAPVRNTQFTVHNTHPELPVSTTTSAADWLGS